MLTTCQFVCAFHDLQIGQAHQMNTDALLLRDLLIRFELKGSLEVKWSFCRG